MNGDAAAGATLRAQDGAPTAGGAAVELRGVTRVFGTVVAVDAVDLDVGHGEFLSILGPSGCGKSTLLRIVGGLDQASAGRIGVAAADVTTLPPEARPTATVFQSGAVFPHLSVEDNVAYPLAIRRVPRRRRSERVAELLALTRLDGLASRFPAELSGGQRQRVAVARALAAEPQVLLMDEPLSALDAALKRELQVELRRIHREVGVTVLFVTHDQEEALVLSDRIAVMRDGRIEQCDVPETLYRNPASEFVARFLGHANVLGLAREPGGDPAAVRWGGFAFAAAAAAEISAGEQIGASVRPACLRLHPPDTPNTNRGEVVDVVYLGDTVRFQVVASGGETVWIEASAAAAADVQPGAAVGLDFEPAEAAVVVRDPSR